MTKALINLSGGYWPDALQPVLIDIPGAVDAEAVFDDEAIAFVENSCVPDVKPWYESELSDLCRENNKSLFYLGAKMVGDDIAVIRYYAGRLERTGGVQYVALVDMSDDGMFCIQHTIKASGIQNDLVLCTFDPISIGNPLGEMRQTIIASRNHIFR